MTRFLDILGNEAQKQFQAKGVQVFVKTNIGPEVKVYDSRSSSESETPGLIQAGIRVVDKDGNPLFEHGGYPSTNYLLSGVIGLSIAFVVVVIGRGLIK